MGLQEKEVRQGRQHWRGQHEDCENWGGTCLPATYRSGRFDEWRAKTHKSVPRVGEAEIEGASGHRAGPNGVKKFRHQKVTQAKSLDKLNKDFERKPHQLKKAREASGQNMQVPGPKGGRGKAGKQKLRYGW